MAANAQQKLPESLTGIAAALASGKQIC
ncbi:hypothetical protein SPHINGOR109_10819 [Sphingorhabdus sp. 109]|nr:hypothetical protein SPHINGOR109_10819 [Sphingorhabdus sp. 109]